MEGVTFTFIFAGTASTRYAHEEEHAAIAGRIGYATDQLSRLKATNVINDAFAISQASADLADEGYPLPFREPWRS